MPSRNLDFPVFDADNHMYETQEALTRHLPAAYSGAVDFVEVHGRTKIVVRGQISNYIPNPTFEVVAAPGAQEEYFKHGNPEGKTYREIMGKPIRSIPAFREPGPRLELMDELGIHKAMMYPTLASLVEERMKDEPDLAHATIHSLNEWMYEQWRFDYEGRIFSTPVITLPIVERAIAELEWVLAHGAKAVLIRPAPAWGLRGPRSFAVEEFDPFWKLVEASGILVVMHASDSGYTRYTSEWEGTRGEYLAFRPTPFGLVSMGHRPVEDAAASLCCHGVLHRFPALKIAFVENGSGWVRPLLRSLEGVYGMMPQEFPENPVEAFHRCIWIHPFHEEDPKGLVELLGSDRVIFGSDYPHPEGMADPISYVEEIADLPPADIERIMSRNMHELLGLAPAA